MRGVIRAGVIIAAAGWLVATSVVEQAGGASITNLSVEPVSGRASEAVPAHQYWQNGCHYHPSPRYCLRYDTYGNCTKWTHRHYCHQHGSSGSSGGGSGY